MKLSFKTYTVEIQNMMYGFGDSRRPSEESASVVEEIVQSQMTQILTRAYEVAKERKTGNNVIVNMEDIIFLMRKSPVKIQRLFKYLSIRDTMSQMSTQNNSEESAVALSGGGDKRVKRCRDFIERIDTDGQLLAAVEERLYDEVRITRLKRLDIMSRDLDERKYAEFTKARQANFRGNKFPSKFYEWIMQSLSDTEEIKIDKLALEILSYLAYETIGHIIDLCLCIRMERSSSQGSHDAVARQMAPIAINPHFPMVQDSSLHGVVEPVSSGNDSTPTTASNGTSTNTNNASKDQLVNTCAIEPWEIREVVRRFQQRPSAFNLYTRDENRSKNCPIFAL